MCGNINLLLESTDNSNHSLCLLGFVCLLQHFILTHCWNQISSELCKIKSAIKT